MTFIAKQWEEEIDEMKERSHHPLFDHEIKIVIIIFEQKEGDMQTVS